jgi:conjugal transfer/type IV secretion protein DotA/TraY
MNASMPFTPCDPTASTCDDVSVQMLTTIFGPVVTQLTQGADPNAVLATANTLASMFSVFNSGILVIAAIILSYTAIVGTINTANDGEMMGKAWSSVFTPLRVVAGAGVLLPTASGYSFIQVLVMTIALWSVGLANGVYKIAVENGLINGSLTSVSAQMGMGKAAKPNPNFPLYDLRQFGSNYLAAAWCAKTVNEIYKNTAGGLSAAVMSTGAPDSVISESKVKSASIFFIKDRNPNTNLGGGLPICGSIKIYTYLPASASEWDNTLDTVNGAAGVFDVATLKANRTAIQAVRVAALQAKQKALMDMITELDAWVGEWPTSINETGWENVDSNRFNLIVNKAQSGMVAELVNMMHADSSLKGIMEKYLADVTNDGWMMAGGFYQKMSGIREEFSKIYAESAGDVSPPLLTSLPHDAAGQLARNSLDTIHRTVVAKALDGADFTVAAGAPRAVDVAGLMPVSLDDLSIDALGSRGDSYFSSMISWSMESITETMIGSDGDVDALARIKTTGDTLRLIESSTFAIDRVLDTSINVLRGSAAVVGSVKVLGNGLDLKPVGDVVRDWIHHNILPQLAQVGSWCGILAFYFGIFLPSLPYTIFMVAAVGWLLQVLQSIVAAPLWAVMHMTPDRTFIGSQTQGYLLLFTLFVRPALVILGLFAAFVIANPVISYLAKAFFAMRTSNVTSSESLGWFIEFLTFRDWLVMFGLLLLPVIYMIFGLSQVLADTVLSWISAGIRPMGETSASDEMRRSFERSSVGGGAISTSRRSANIQHNSSNNTGGDSGGGGSPGGSISPSSGGGGGSISGSGRGSSKQRLLSGNSQGVTPKDPQ